MRINQDVNGQPTNHGCVGGKREPGATTNRCKYPTSVPPGSFFIQLQLLNDIDQHTHLPVPIYKPDIQHRRRPPRQHRRGKKEDRVDPRTGQPGGADNESDDKEQANQEDG